MSDSKGSLDGNRRLLRSPSQVSVDASQVQAGYANFCRVTGTPEEVLLDFGLNDQPLGQHDRPIRISHRIVVNFYTAKRMLAALQVTIQKHEQAFGKLETDIGKRVTPSRLPAEE